MEAVSVHRIQIYLAASCSLAEDKDMVKSMMH